MTIRFQLIKLFAVALLLKGCQPTPPPGPVCNPYAPDGGLFYTNTSFTLVPTSPKQVGSYSISLVNNQVQVISGNTTAPDALISVPAGMLASYLFFGTNNRFVIVDLYSDPSTSPSSITYQPVVVDLTAWQQGAAPQPGHFLPSVSQPITAQQHIYPSPGYTTTSPGSGLAFFVWYGLGSGQIADAGIYRSDTGAQLCLVPSYTAVVQAIAKVAPGAVQILDGGTVIQSCPIPSGSLKITPALVNFGSVPANKTATQTVTLTNAGTDCLTVTAIASSGPFSPSNFPTGGIILTPGASQSLSLAFNPNNVPGNYNATLAVTANPPVGNNSISVVGVATAPAPPQLALKANVRPSGDPGLFNLLVDGSVRASNISNGGTSGTLTLSVGSHSVAETAGNGTSLSSYTISIDCGSGPTSGSSATVSLALGDNKTCTVLDLGAPHLTVTKSLSPPADPGLFNLLIDGAVKASGVGNGGTTGPQVLSVGSHTVTESAAPGTSLATYTSSTGGACSANGSVTLAAGDDKTCNISNSRPTPPPPPSFSPGAGPHLCPIKVSLSDPGASIFFTTDRSTPTTSSPQYSSPITLNQSTTITAIAVNSNGQSSAVASSYTCVSYDTFEIDITVGTDDARTDSALEATLTTTSGSSTNVCLKYSDNGSSTFCPQSHPGITWQPGQTYASTINWDSGASSLADFSTLNISLTQFPGFAKGDDNWDIQEIDVWASSSHLPGKQVLLLTRSGNYPVQQKSCYARLKHPHGMNPTSVTFNFNATSAATPGAPETAQDDDGTHVCPYCQETQF